MKKMVLLLFLTLVFATYGFCHSPSGIEAAVNKSTLDLIVSHSVSDPTTHYVKKITVRLNGENAAEKDFNSQTDAETQKTSFDIAGLKKGDSLEITAYCSRYGDVTKKITVE